MQKDLFTFKNDALVFFRYWRQKNVYAVAKIGENELKLAQLFEELRLKMHRLNFRIHGEHILSDKK